MADPYSFVHGGSADHIRARLHLRAPVQFAPRPRRQNVRRAFQASGPKLHPKLCLPSFCFLITCRG